MKSPLQSQSTTDRKAVNVFELFQTQVMSVAFRDLSFILLPYFIYNDETFPTTIFSSSVTHLEQNLCMGLYSGSKLWTTDHPRKKP